ncbi:DNA adenine methylase [bacterium]|nr:DNA adenine methylase [bacterium]
MLSRNPRIILEKLDSVNNPSSMHGIYPYRGKISAIDAANIISQLPNCGTLLDPFCGSGTIVYEAIKHGMNAIGVDNNPLAIQIAKSKICLDHSVVESCEEIIKKAKQDLVNLDYDKMPDAPSKSFHSDTANEIMCIKKYYAEMSEYLKGVFYGTIALAARGCNGYKWTSSTVGKNIEPKTYICFFDKFLSKAKKHERYILANEDSVGRIIHGDSRRISEYIPPKSIDFVFTSPPYFDGLDYTAYYGKLIYEIFGEDRTQIKQNLIQHSDSYLNDMTMVLSELDKVTTDDALIIFVVGDKKIKSQVINGGEFFNNIKKASYISERRYSGTSSQVFDTLNKTDRKEQIVVWDKHNGEVIIYDE